MNNDDVLVEMLEIACGLLNENEICSAASIITKRRIAGFVILMIIARTGYLRV